MKGSKSVADGSGHALLDAIAREGQRLGKTMNIATRLLADVAAKTMRATMTPATMLFAAVMSAAFLLEAAPAKAVDIFSVSGIEVDVSAESAVEAQAKAIEQARSIGLERLMQKLTTPAHFDRLPAVAGLDMKTYARSHEVESEQVAATRYVASILVAYDGEAVQRLMRPASVPIVLAPSEPLLVVPAIDRGGRLDVWSDNHPWREAWWAEAERNTLLDLRLPLGDLADVATLSASLHDDEIPAALAALAERYQVASAILLVARPTGGALGDEEATEVEVAEATRVGWGYGLQRFRTGGSARDGGTVWRLAARRTMDALEAAWKPDHLVRFGTAASLSVHIPLVDLASWVHINQILDAVPEVQSVAIDAFSQQETSLTLAYVGGLAQLDRALGARGLELVEETNRWLLRRAEGRPGGQLR